MLIKAMYELGLGAEFLAASFQKDDADRWRSICARCSAALSRLAPSRPRALRRLAGSRSSPQQTTDFRRTMAKVCKSGGEGTFAERHGNGEVAPTPAVRAIEIERQGSTQLRHWPRGFVASAT